MRAVTDIDAERLPGERRLEDALAAARGESLAGRASVIDGDTVEIHGTTIRLHGIDAPESQQLWSLEDSLYRCGQKTALALSDYIGQRALTCIQTDTDRYGRVVAICRLGAEDLTRTLDPLIKSQSISPELRQFSDTGLLNAAAEMLGVSSGGLKAILDLLGVPCNGFAQALLAVLRASRSRLERAFREPGPTRDRELTPR